MLTLSEMYGDLGLSSIKISGPQTDLFKRNLSVVFEKPHALILPHAGLCSNISICFIVLSSESPAELVKENQFTMSHWDRI